MNKLTNTPVPELLLKRIQLIYGEKNSNCKLRDPQRINEFATILQFISNGLPLSIRHLAKIHNENHKYSKQQRSSRSSMRRRVNQLLEIGMIKRIKNHFFDMDNPDKGKHQAAHYVLTDEARMLMLQSGRGYKSFSDMKKRLHPVYMREYRPAFSMETNIMKESSETPEAIRFDVQRQVKEMDTGRDDFKDFLAGKERLEEFEFVILKHYALSTLNKAGKAAAIRNLPADNFNITYKLLKSGRVHPIPHLLHGNSFLQYLRPKFDIHLEYGKLMYLDYGTQEIRLLAIKSNDPGLLDLALYEPDLNRYFQREIFKGIPTNLSKRYRSGWSYGSQGGGKLIEPTKEYLKDTNFNGSAKDFIKHHFKALDIAFPEVAVYREEIAQQWLTDGFLIAPGGIKRGLDKGVLNKEGTPSIDKVRRKGLSHIVQGYGAWLARRIIADSLKLEHAILLFPVHDGFVFYLPNDNVESAYHEARNLLAKTAEDLVAVPMPHKIEWVWDSTGPMQVDAFEMEMKLSCEITPTSDVDPHTSILNPYADNSLG